MTRSAILRKSLAKIPLLCSLKRLLGLLVLFGIVDLILGLTLKIMPLLIGCAVVGVTLCRNRIREPQKPLTLADMLDRLPKRGDFALIAIIRGEPEYRVALDLKSKVEEGQSIRIDVYFTNHQDGDVVSVAYSQEIEPSGKCAISAELPAGVANFSVNLREGVNLFRLGEPGDSTLPATAPPAGRFGRLADSIIREAEPSSRAGLAATRKALAKALHPDMNSAEVQERTAALAWANAELDRIQASLARAKLEAAR